MGENGVLLLSTSGMIILEKKTYIGVKSRLLICDCNDMDMISVMLLLQAVSLFEESVLTSIILRRN